ncbi:MAG TPA: alpha/beta hydrolase, partial [Novosphingobium sp.]
FPDFGSDDWQAFARRTCTQRPDGTIAFAYDPAIARSVSGDQPDTVPPDLWPLWALLARTPVLVVRGALSDLLAAETVDEMGRRHPGPFAVAEVPRVGHAPLLTEPPALAAITAFLADHAG